MSVLEPLSIGVLFHFYADGSQIYVQLKQENTFSTNELLECIAEIKVWMSMNFLLLNDKKNEVMFCPSDASKVQLNSVL